MVATREQLLEKLQYASPLDSTTILQEMELYDKQSSQEIIDEVYAQFETGENIKDEIMKPVFFSVVDGFLESTEMGKQARQKGLTASRVIQECEAFRYDGENKISEINGFIEYKNINEDKIIYEARRNELIRQYNNGTLAKDKLDKALKDIQYGGTLNSQMTQEYSQENRAKLYEDKKAMYKYRDEKLVGQKTYVDEYTGQQNLTSTKNPNMKYNEDTAKKLAVNVDHVVPLKQVHAKFKVNYALDDSDIKRIANINENFALTSAMINNGTGTKTDSMKGLGKGDLTNEEYIKAMAERGTPLDAQTIENMRKLDKQANKAMDAKANEIVMQNLLGKGNVNEATMKEAVQKFKNDNNGKSPTKEERLAIQKELEKRKTAEIRNNLTDDAINQSKDYAVGNIILYIIKPVYYELSDCLKNGIAEGVGASSIGEAFGIRFGRVKDYVLANAAAFLGDNAWEFVKGFISSLIEGIIGLFVGIFKQVLKIVKEGIKIFTQSMGVLFGPESATMTSAEKGNAIVSILGSGIIAIAGIGLEALLNKLGIGEPWSIVFSTLLSGIAATLFMYLLNKADLFSAKAEKRKARIEEIFGERIKEINMAAETYNIVAVDVLKQQRESFENVVSVINDGLQGDNIEKINQGLYQMADFLKIELPYRSTDGFCEYMDSKQALSV